MEMNNSIEILQEWIGYVVSIDNDTNTFYSIMEDRTQGGTDDSIEMKLSDVPDNQLHLVQEGAIFTLTIDRITSNNMSLVNNTLEFMKPKKLTQKELDDISKSAEIMARRFNWE
jgi:hypothetical protein